MASTDNKKQLRWEKLLGKLSPATRARLSGSVTATVRSTEKSASRSLLSQLSPVTQSLIEDYKSPTDRFPEGRVPKYCLVEAPDGDFPTMRMYTSAEAMACRVKELEGEDVVVMMFLGMPIPVTKGPHRIIVLPNNTFLCLDPVVRTIAAAAMDQDISVQEDGFLGDLSLSMSSKLLADDEISANQANRGKTSQSTDDESDDSGEDDTDSGDDDGFDET